MAQKDLTTFEKKINTDVKNLKWYNWTLIIFESLILVGLIAQIIEMIINAEDYLFNRSGLQFTLYMAIATIVMLHIWKRSAYSMLKSQLTLAYSDVAILSLETATEVFHTPIPLNDIQSLVRKSSVSLEIIFNRPIENDDVLKLYYLRNRSIPSISVIINGNEKELDMFCEDLKKINIRTDTNYILHEDPRKFRAVVVIIFTTFFFVFVAVMTLARYKTR